MHTVRDYASALKKGQLLGFHCQSCSREWLTSFNVCPFCGSSSIVDAVLPAKGRVLAYTYQVVVPEQLQSKAPYVIAVIELSDKSRIQARIENYSTIMGNIIGRDAVMSGGDESGLVFRLT